MISRSLTQIKKNILRKSIQLTSKISYGMYLLNFSLVSKKLMPHVKVFTEQVHLSVLNFLFLRADSHAQYEIRVYAETMLDTVKKWVPITHAAFLDYRVGAVHVSAKGKKVIQQMVKGEKVTYESSGLSKRDD